MVFRVLLTVGALIFGCQPLFGEDPAGVLQAKVFHSSMRCAECHVQIHDLWQRSLHSRSLTDPIFDAAYSRAYRETAGRAREICLRCHAPVAAYTEDLELQNPVSREGVTCDFCHSVTAVDLGASKPFRVTLDGIKRGPLKGARSPAHQVQASSLHESSEFCAGCHEYATPDGLLIFSTYSEWRVSPQAKAGKTCQQCHMPVSKGLTVPPGLGSGRTEINLHNISGGHSREQVQKAASLAIIRLWRSGDGTAGVEVEVANVGSGHYIPTGMPTRKLVLEVDLYVNERRIQRFQRTYQRVLLDKAGKRIEQDYRVLLDAARLLSDNRLRPGQRRVERFVAPVLEEGTLRAEARLRYVYEPELLSRQEMDILMVSDKQSQ